MDSTAPGLVEAIAEAELHNRTVRARIGNYLSEQPWDDGARRDAILTGVLSGAVIGGLFDPAKERPGEWRSRWERN